jgi:hypothetical protein
VTLAFAKPFHFLYLQHFPAALSQFGHNRPAQSSPDANKAVTNSVLIFRFLFRP